MSEKLQLLPWVAGADDGGHDGGDERKSCDTEDAGDEDLLGGGVVLGHWEGRAGRGGEGREGGAREGNEKVEKGRKEQGEGRKRIRRRVVRKEGGGGGS